MGKKSQRDSQVLPRYYIKCGEKIDKIDLVFCDFFFFLCKKKEAYVIYLQNSVLKMSKKIRKIILQINFKYNSFTRSKFSDDLCCQV